MTKITKYKASFLERAYYALNKIYNGYYINVVVEGCITGNFDIKTFREAVEKLSDLNPCMRFKFKGFLNMTYLVDSKNPIPIKVIEESSWDGMSSDTLDFINTREINDKYLAEIYIVKGKILRILFRIHHAITDGRGAILWIEDLFRIMRNEKPKSTFSQINEYELMKKFNIKPVKIDSKYCITPTGKAEGLATFNTRYIRKSIDINNSIPNLTGHIASELVKLANKKTDEIFRVAVPVDLRFREKQFNTTRNFSGIIYLDIDNDDKPSSITLNILKKLKNYDDLKFEKEDIMSNYIPIFIIKYFMKRKFKYKLENNKCTISTTISNIGYIETKKFNTSNFSARSLFVFNLQSYSPAFFLITNCDNKKLEITLSVPDVFRTHNRDEILLENLSIGLKTILHN
jgi:hypothetical protein